jgi:hypothetical protein
VATPRQDPLDQDSGLRASSMYMDQVVHICGTHISGLLLFLFPQCI